ncbi:hypothetical protein CBR_g55534 [Chara braunii]|uniref:DUF659 domain-containing protein n=1 Tax=Chara braunii TaxID=69332 RepID=A0A388MD65_CHABU|nr:hypothetical protein CBR_g55534 [Chara braunii]|eukprot:GBG92453.1 hypothetical protein CBR_g55534 [Chara braunii]
MKDWWRRAGKGSAMEGSSKRKEGGSDSAPTPTGKRLRQQKVTDFYGGEWVARLKKTFLRWLYSSGVSFNAFRNQAWKAYQQVLLEQPGSSPRAVLPNQSAIANMRAVETHRAELAEELEEVRQPFRVPGTTLLSNGRKSLDKRPIVNFLVAGSQGVVVYTTINREGEPDDAVEVLRRWVTIFHEFSFGGPQWVNAICTDSCFCLRGGCKGIGLAVHASCTEEDHLAPVLLRGGRARVAAVRSSGDAHVVLRLSRREELGSPRGHSHEEAQPIVRLTEYRRVGCGYVLPWQRDEGMLDCQAGLEAEPVRTGMRRGMTEEEIAGQVALITRDPIGASAPPSADAVFGKRACIFRSYPSEDDSDEEPVPKAADDPALRIPREIDETQDDPDSEEMRADTARRAADRVDKEMLGGEEDPAAEVTITFPGDIAGGGGTGGSSNGGGDVTIATAVDEIASSSAAAVLEEMAASMLEEEAPAARGAATVDGQVAAAGGAAGGAAAVEVEDAVAVEEEEAPSAAAMEGGVAGLIEEEIAAQAKVQRGGDDERLMQQFLTEELDPVIAGMTPGVARGLGISDSEMGTPLDFDLSMGLPPSCGRATSKDRALSRDEAAGQTFTQTLRERTTIESPDAARDIMERERARLLASSDPRAQVFARALEEVRLRERQSGYCVQGGVMARKDVAEGVAAEAVDEALSGGAEAADVAVEGRPQAGDEVVQAGQRRDEGL